MIFWDCLVGVSVVDEIFGIVGISGLIGIFLGIEKNVKEFLFGNLGYKKNLV